MAQPINLYAGHESKLGSMVEQKLNKTAFNDFNSHLLDVQGVFFRATKALCKEDLEFKAKMEQHVRALCETSLHGQHIESCMQKALQDTKQQYLMQQSQHQKTPASQRFAELVSQPSSTLAAGAAVESHEFYKKFLLVTRSRQQNAGEDDDIEVMQAEGDDSGLQRFKCPFTMEIMKKPMRNKACNHVYDQSSVAQILKTERCPVRGCKTLVRQTNMFADEDLQYEIDEYLLEQQPKKKKKAKKYDGDDDGSTSPVAPKSSGKKRRIVEED